MSGENSHAPPVKKKVKAYPIEVTLDLRGIKKQLEIVHLTAIGFIATVKPPLILFVGEDYQCAFELPASREAILSACKVMKTYDRLRDAKAETVERMAEVHFVHLPADIKKHILSFLATIGQERTP